MRINAFQGIRYRGEPAAAGRLAGPPYDQIDAALRDRLQAREHHFAHLVRPRGGPEEDPHRRAARLHAEWRESGILQLAPEPALYLYALELASGAKRLGLCALVGLDEPETGAIQPHEQTVAKTVDERLGLLRATGVDLEPILLLSDDGGRLDRLLLEDLGASAPLVEHQDEGGHRHLLFPLGGEKRIVRYRELLAPASAVIADGHHRWEVARRFALETTAPPDSTAAAKLAVITSLSSPGLLIDPIHRAVREAGGTPAGSALVSSRQAWSGAGGAELAAAVAAAPQPAFGVWERGRSPEIWRLDPAAAPAELSEGRRGLAVTLLHGALFPALGLPADAATDGTVVYRSDPERLFTEMGRGEYAFGVWLPPMSAAAFSAAVAEGGLLPPKSTRFLPKLASGLVWAGHDSRLG